MLSPQFRMGKEIEALRGMVEELRSRPLPDALSGIYDWAAARLEEMVRRLKEVEEKHRADMEAAKTRELALEQRAQGAESQASALAASLESANGRAHSSEEALALARSESAEAVVTAQEKLAETLAKLDGARAELEATRAGRATDIAAATADVAKLRAQLISAPHPHAFNIDIARDAKGLIRYLDVRIGNEQFRVDVTRNAAGKIKEMKRRTN